MTASARNLPAWFQERFPPAHGVLFAVMFVTALLYGRFLTWEGEVTLWPFDVVGFVAVWCFFLTLRVFDEHKDYELDLRNHPDRVLQSGRVTLGHLKWVGGVAILAQAVGSAAIDAQAYPAGDFGGTVGWWLLVITWTSLMGKEFFASEWLEERLVLYALSHMVVMPLALVWMARMGTGTNALPLDVAWLAGLSFLSGAAFEVTRKAKGAEEERATIQSYSQVWGPRGAAAVVGVLLVAQAAVEVAMLRLILEDVGPGWYAGIVVPTLLPFVGLALYAKDPTAKARKVNEAATSLAMLAAYVVLSAALISARGLAWG